MIGFFFPLGALGLKGVSSALTGIGHVITSVSALGTQALQQAGALIKDGVNVSTGAINSAGLAGAASVLYAQQFLVGATTRATAILARLAPL